MPRCVPLSPAGCAVPGGVAVASARLQRVQRRPRAGALLPLPQRRRADAPRAASRRRTGVQLGAVREASKDVPPIGTRKAEGAADGAPRPPHRAARGSAARCASRPLLAPAAASSCARCGDDARADAPAPASFVVRSPRPRRPCLKDADRSGALHPPWRATCLPVLQRGASDLR